MNRLALLTLAGGFVLAGCDAAEPAPIVLNVQTAVDIEADPNTGRDPNTGQPIANNLFTLYDLDAGEVVLSSSETNASVRAQDSTSTVWDIGFRGTTLIVNGGTSGPGQGAAQIVTGTFASLTEAPAGGYVADGANTTCPTVQTPGGAVPGSTLAICTGSGNGWYNYAPSQNLISPLAGRTIVLTTGTGDYAKVRILSYYQGNPPAPVPTTDEDRYFTFEYVVQPDGSRGFETTLAD